MSFVVHRVSKSAARYTDAGGREKCAYCRFFMAPRACGKVIGPVSPQGWCKYFSRQVAQQYSGAGITGGGGGPPGATLALDFMSSGNMPPGVAFSRASTATWTDASGVIQTAAVNQPRWDYDPVTHVLRGLLLQGANGPQAADIASMPTNASWFNPAASTLMTETIHPTAAGVNGHEVDASIDDGGSNRMMLFRFQTSNVMQGQIDPSIYTQTIGSSLIPGAVTKAAIAYKAGAQSSALNGVLGPATSVASVPGAMTTLSFGLSIGAFPLNGYLRRVQYWPRQLSNAELQQVTT